MPAGIAHKISETLAIAARLLADAGITGARRDAQILLSHVTGLTRVQILTEPDAPLAAEARIQFEKLIERRANREPVSHLVGLREFWSHSFIVNGAVLDPRPDSEILIDAVLAHCPEKDATLSILDLGTGSGCLLLSLLSERPRATGIGVDISSAALAIADRNAERLGLAARAHFVCCDWNAAIGGLFDIVICNPPYIAKADISQLEPEVASFEPRLALEGGDDGLAAYRRLLPEFHQILAPSGIAVVEFGAGQCESVSGILRESGFTSLGIHRDLGDIDRCIVFRSDPIFTVT